MDYRNEFESGSGFHHFLATVQSNPVLWASIYDRAETPPALLEQARRCAGHRRFLVLNEDWCGDAVNIVPHVARLAESAGIELRIIARDRNPKVMDAHLTRGSRSIPIVMVLDEQYRELGWWGPRPRELQQWFYDQGKALPPVERYRAMRRWYAVDAGESIARELVELLTASSQAAA